MLAVDEPMVVKGRKEEQVDVLLALVADWKHAVAAHERSLRRRDAELMRARRRLATALGGITLRRWEQLMSENAAIRSGRAAREIHLARKHKTDVLAALRAIEVADANELEVVAAGEILATLTRRLLVYGSAAETLLGRTLLELRGMTDPRSLNEPNDIVAGGDGARSRRRSPELPRKEVTMAPTRDEVKNYQRRLAQLDGAHAKATGRLTSAMKRRADVMAAQDRLVAEAEAGVRRAVSAMAAGVGAELTAMLLDIDLSEVRRLAKGADGPSTTP